MELETLRLGTLTVEEKDVVRFPQGIPGLQHLRSFVLCESPDMQPFKFLQSVDEPEISFLLLIPSEVYPDYHLEVTEEVRKELAYTPGNRLVIYVIVTPATAVGDTTVNLLAPVVINADKMRGCQVIQEDSPYRIKQRLFSGEITSSPRG